MLGKDFIIGHNSADNRHTVQFVRLKHFILMSELDLT